MQRSLRKQPIFRNTTLQNDVWEKETSAEIRTANV